jgi:hypothetical protein
VGLAEAEIAGAEDEDALAAGDLDVWGGGGLVGCLMGAGGKGRRARSY